MTSPRDTEPAAKPSWPPGFWERLDALGPATDDWVVPEPLPPSTYRDAVIEEFVEWLNAGAIPDGEEEKPA